MPNDLREQADKVIARCRYLAQFTRRAGPDQAYFSFPRDARLHAGGARMDGSCRHAGRNRCRGQSPRAISGDLQHACLMIGSHLDTVPNSGAFDGVLGVMLGLALVEALNGERLPFSIELVGFSEEEGVRFHLPFIGSRALVGRLDSELLATKDGDGISIAQALTVVRIGSAEDQGLPRWART